MADERFPQRAVGRLRAPLMKMKSNEETLAQLADALVANFPSHFNLLCGRCSCEERASRKPKQHFSDPLGRASAAEHFFANGWRYDRVPLCPTCAKQFEAKIHLPRTSPDQALQRTRGSVVSLGLWSFGAYLILILLLLAGTAGAQVTAPAAQGYDAFRLMQTRNIFDPNRQGPVRSDEAPPPRQNTITRPNSILLTGAMVTESKTLAFFSGSRPEYSRIIPVGEKIADFTVKKISAAEVELEHAGKAIVVPVGASVPLQGTSAAGMIMEPLPPGASAAAPASTAPPVNAPPPPTGDKAEILRRMMERCQKEMSP